jgi:hypothetical protein
MKNSDGHTNSEKIVVRQDQVSQILVAATSSWGCSMASAREAFDLVVRLGIAEVER